MFGRGCHGLQLAAERRPDWLTQEEFDSMARSVKFAKDHKAAIGDTGEAH